jgi:hypothetical protein
MSVSGVELKIVLVRATSEISLSSPVLLTFLPGASNYRFRIVTSACFHPSVPLPTRCHNIKRRPLTLSNNCLLYNTVKYENEGLNLRETAQKVQEALALIIMTSPTSR